MTTAKMTVTAATGSAVVEVDGITFVFEVTGNHDRWVANYVAASPVPVVEINRR